MEVTAVEDPAARSDLCRTILEALPDWFGIPEAVERYIRDVASLPTFAVGDDGFLTLKLHTAAAAEFYVMGVLPASQGHGMGTALVAAAEDYLREREIEFLQVKTLGPSNPDPEYARTRHFYETRGFRPLEELTQIWDKTNPCLIMVKSLR